MNEDNIFFWLSVIANIAQLQSYNILQNDFNNTDLMKYLKHQDDLLDEIIKQNKEILSYLKGEHNGN